MTEIKVAAKLLGTILLNPAYFARIESPEGVDVAYTRSSFDLLDQVNACDITWVRVGYPTEPGKPFTSVGQFMLVWGNAADGEELIADYSDNEYCNRIYERVMG